PNPGTGRVFVLLPGGMAAMETTFEVFDARGRRVLEQHSNNLKKVELDLTQVAAGLYSILIRTGKEHTVRTITIHR
ncbi:MAG TPA: T9SS type A sorting domain-containing protein, partial [Saprospiraceae bacterium]|nr:T9SS type A sorting domain-containing protein [Saprospiraceae bacterium]